jgi:hypothetical protein
MKSSHHMLEPDADWPSSSKAEATKQMWETEKGEGGAACSELTIPGVAANQNYDSQVT